MHFAVYNEDGRITQSNKVFDPTDYDKRLKDMGYNFVQSNHDSPLSMNDWWAPNGNLTLRQDMQVQISKTRIKANANDYAVIIGAPKKVKFMVSVLGAPVWTGELPDGELELSVPTPGLYRIALELWPYRSFEATIEAI